MKHLPSIILLLLFAFAAAALRARPTVNGQQPTAAEIWVAPNGSDANPGTKQQPLATLALALRKTRELRRLNDPAIAGGMHIILRGGPYRLDEPVFIRPEDAGTASSP